MAMQTKRERLVRAAAAALVAAATLWAVSAAATADDMYAAAQTLREEGAVMLLRFERGELHTGHGLSVPARLALCVTPLLRAQEAAPARPVREGAESAAPNSLQPDASPPLPREETREVSDEDNGVSARTLRPAASDGYLTVGRVYIHNASAAALRVSDLDGEPAAEWSAEEPQVLIIHTHGSEAYTMPPGEEYVPSDDHRTTDKAYSVVRVGDEIARVLGEAGIGVVHDRELYDYPHYSGAYDRSLAAIERWRAEHPSIVYILDVHRDAVEDAQGRQYKLVCAEEPGAAQMEFVIGTDGGGAQHDNWRENLKLAAAVQETLLERYPTLMRPITVRNSRYNQHVTEGSLLLEVGTAGNSLSEALEAGRLFAAGFADTIKK